MDGVWKYLRTPKKSNGQPLTDIAEDDPEHPVQQLDEFLGQFSMFSCVLSHSSSLSSLLSPLLSLFSISLFLYVHVRMSLLCFLACLVSGSSKLFFIHFLTPHTPHNMIPSLHLLRFPSMHPSRHP